MNRYEIIRGKERLFIKYKIMKYKFLGKPDKRFSKLITGRIYELDVTAIVGLPFRPLILNPFKCPYSNWETFYQNWEPVIQNKPYEPIIQDKLLY